MAKHDIKEGSYDVNGARFALVVSRFNAEVVARLEQAALDTLKRHGVAAENITVVPVPGAFEIPFMAKRLADGGSFDVVITLGAVVRGGTPHFEYVAGECARGVAEVARESGVPIIFGVLTTDDMAQALERAGGSEGNKGSESAIAAMDMVTTLRGFAGQ
ncbi:MAG TPA: 6,7-dimethyl-8-ribityllumazine synthase [Gammaproteobacteria bacterium]|nr:6,7-dimethyl-8-ribityllumazine synthase [Gammaproteobacteria bacterium]